VFREVVREGSISRAAAKLFITQPSVTIQIKRLEQTFGVKLVERLHGRFVPTAAGERLFLCANQMFEIQSHTRSSLEEMRAGNAGLLRFGTATGALYYLAQALKWLKETRPRLEIKLTVSLSEEIGKAVAENQADLGVVWLPCSAEGVFTQRLLRAPYTMVVAPQNPLGGLKTVKPKMLHGQNFIAAVKGSGSHALFIDEVLKRHSVRASVIMEFNHTEPIKQAAEANLGIGIVPWKAAERELAERRLIALNVTGMTLARDLALAYRPPKLQEPLVAFVVERLKSKLRNSGDSAKQSLPRPVRA
jgi:DNA-binding transcriptional LysR family regulator